MKAIIVALAIYLPLTAFAGESDGVKNTFKGYKAAILNQEGEDAASLVAKQTIDQYQQYVDWALSADRETLQSLSFINRFQVLLLKQRIPADTLKALNGRSVFAYAVDKDWIGKSGVVPTELGKINISENSAVAEVLIDGQTAPMKFHFLKESELWKFDLVPVIQNTNQALKAAAKQSGMTENEFLFSVIESVSGKKVEDAIWNPMQ